MAPAVERVQPPVAEEGRLHRQHLVDRAAAAADEIASLDRLDRLGRVVGHRHSRAGRKATTATATATGHAVPTAVACAAEAGKSSALGDRRRALTSGGDARAGGVAVVRRRADDGTAGAGPIGASIVRGAGVAVVAERAVGFGVRRALTRGGVAGSFLTLVGSGALDRIAAHADAGLARNGLRARVAVDADCTVGFGRIGAEPGPRVADAGEVALILRPWAGDRISPDADAVVTLARLLAGVVGETGREFRLGRVGAKAGGRIARARIMAMIARRARHGRAALAYPGLTDIADGAGVAVTAAHAVGGVRIVADAGCGLARPGHVTLIARRADHRRARAGPTGADIIRGAGVAVVAIRAVIGIGPGARTAGGIADLAGVGRVRRTARVARFGDEAGSRQLRMIAAGAGARVARALGVTRVRRDADDWGAANAAAGSIAGVGPGAGIGVVAGQAQQLRHVGDADTGLADVMAAWLVHPAERAVRFIDRNAGACARIAGDARLAGGGSGAALG